VSLALDVVSTILVAATRPMAVSLCSLENTAPNCCVRYRTQLLVFIVLIYTLEPLKRSTRPHHNRPSKFEEGLPYRSYKHGTLDKSQCLARRKS
jgi:hypothetical protein